MPPRGWELSEIVDVVDLVAKIPGGAGYVTALADVIVAAGRVESDAVEAGQAETALASLIEWIWAANAWIEANTAELKKLMTSTGSSAFSLALQAVEKNASPVKVTLQSEAFALATAIRNLVVQAMATGTVYWQPKSTAGSQAMVSAAAVSGGKQSPPPPVESIPLTLWTQVELSGHGAYGKKIVLQDLPDAKGAIAWGFASAMVKEQVKLKSALSQISMQIGGGDPENNVVNLITLWWLGQPKAQVTGLKQPQKAPPLVAGPVKKALDQHKDAVAALNVAKTTLKDVHTAFIDGLAQAGFPADEIQSVVEALSMLAEIEGDVLTGKYLADKAASKQSKVNELLQGKHAKSTTYMVVLGEKRNAAKAKLDAAKAKAKAVKKQYGEDSAEYRDADAARNLTLDEWQSIADQAEAAVRGSNLSGGEAHDRRNEPQGGVYARAAKAKAKISKAKDHAKVNVNVKVKGYTHSVQVGMSSATQKQADLVEQKTASVAAAADAAGEVIKKAALLAQQLIEEIKKAKEDNGLPTTGTTEQEVKAGILAGAPPSEFPWWLVAGAVAVAVAAK